MLKAIITIAMIGLLVNWWRRAATSDTFEKQAMAVLFLLSFLLMLYLYWFDPDH